MTLIEYPTTVEWNGLILGGYVRNSSWVQRDNDRADFQLVDMGDYAKARGYAVRWFDERATSGGRMNRRVKLQTLLGLIAQHEVHGIFCADVSRLSRDERLLDPMVIADTLREHAEGRLLTHGRELDLRRPDDWKLYTVLALVASWQRGDTVVASAQGYKIAVQKAFRGDREVFRRGKIKLGYKRVPLIDQLGEIRHSPNGRTLTTLARDLADDEQLTALAEELDRHITLNAVIAALRKRRVTGPFRATDGETWTARGIRAIIKDQLYEGIWTASDTPSTVQRLLEADGIRVGTAEYPVPALTWFPTWRMNRWREKFVETDRPHFRARTHPHPLLGIAYCAPCAIPLGASGAKQGLITYRCPKRKYGCPTDTLITERVMLRVMARQLPQILEQTADVTSAVWAKLAIGPDGGIDARITAIRERERVIQDTWLRRMQEPPDWLLAEVQELSASRQRLLQERAAIDSQRDLAQIADEVLTLLRTGRLSDLASQPPERQAAVWRRLISEARFTVSGTSGRGRIITVELIPVTLNSGPPGSKSSGKNQVSSRPRSKGFGWRRASAT